MGAPSTEPLLVVVGPTASGKSDLAMHLAERTGGEIIGADSVQVYREFDIGSGKPTIADRDRVHHHLVDCFEPMEALDAARYAALADSRIAEIRSRGATPIICGGTYLWVRALTRGLSEGPPANPTVRDRHRRIAENQGRRALHAELARADPEAAERLAPNDLVRVSRALEVFAVTGVRLSDHHAAHGFREQRHRHRLVGIRRDKAELEARIAERVDAMFQAGWIEEVRRLIARGYLAARAMKSVGYRQIAVALAAPTFDELALRLEVARATRIFARRQRTWLRDEPVRWIEADDVARTDVHELLAGD